MNIKNTKQEWKDRYDILKQINKAKKITLKIEKKKKFDD